MSNISLQHTPGKGPPKLSLGVVGWLRANLFSNWYNSVLTLIAMWILYNFFSGLISWGLLNAVFSAENFEGCRDQGTGACWPGVAANFQLFMVGPYPFDERYRTNLAFFLVAGTSLLAFFPSMRANKWYGITWVLMGFVAFFLVRGVETFSLPVVDTNLWGGLLITVILSVVGIVLAFPIGIILALGRRSKLPVLRGLSVAYIELIRGVPLITVLFMSSVMLPLFFPEGFNMDKLLRAQIGIIMFAAAYLAEVVRGGLQGLNKGQEEAAAALGLSYWQTMTFIVMPQALRIVIPPIVSTFISLLKDTSLVTIIGLFDMLGITAMVSANPNWLGVVTESYIFVGFIYWAMCFGMSRYAVQLEKRFDTGR